MPDNSGLYWRCVTLLGRLDATDEHRSEAADLLPALDPDELYGQILGSRVYLPALANVRLLEPTSRTAAVLGHLEALVTQEQQRRAAAHDETLTVLTGAAARNAQVIKGLSLREHYARPELRHEGDIDLHVRDWSSAWSVVEMLRARGWDWDTTEFSWLKWTDGGHLYGQLTLVLPDNETPVSRVDLHIGPFSVGHAGNMPLTGWRIADVMGVRSTVPDCETELALIAAHALNDSVLSMKDVNDLHTILQQPASTDWATVEELCRAAQAQDVLAQLLSVTGNVYPEHEVRSATRPEALVLRQAAEERVDRAARLALRDELARRGSAEAAERMAQEARRYYSADLRPRVIGSTDTVSPLGRNRHTCVRLLPLSTWSRLKKDTPVPHVVEHSEQSWAPGLRLVTSGSGQVVRASDEIFVPTVWGDVHPTSLALADQLSPRA
ncbi:nucleotidyltransferase family protein [Streptomyces uncialis]|uniref:nucleotidyltransferase family protein n=1 Tax=Streptomyces uncialis TaxID=1048205 RepID=UPI002E34902F|nr:nucleotidyltransferase family protein [Streptomyces uncialis]